MERQIAGLRSTLPNPELAPEAEAARATAAAAGTAAGEATEAASEGSRALGRAAGNPDRPLPGARPQADARRQADRSGRVESGPGLPGRDPSPGHVGPRAPLRRGDPGDRGGGPGARDLREPPGGRPPHRQCSPRKPVDSSFVFAAVPANAITPTVHAKTVAYILGGLGVALGGTAIGVYFWNRGLNQDAQGDQSYLQRAPDGHRARGEYNAEVDALNRNSYLTVGLAAASVGLLAGGTYLYLYERKRDAKRGQADRARSWASVTPGGLFWNGVW